MANIQEIVNARYNPADAKIARYYAICKAIAYAELSGEKYVEFAYDADDDRIFSARGYDYRNNYIIGEENPVSMIIFMKDAMRYVDNCCYMVINGDLCHLVQESIARRYQPLYKGVDVETYKGRYGVGYKLHIPSRWRYIHGQTSSSHHMVEYWVTCAK